MEPDVLVVGAGPAGLAIAAQLCRLGLRVAGIAPAPPDTLWPQTYGIWHDEAAALGLAHLLAASWPDTIAYLGTSPHHLGRTYALIDNAALQSYLLRICAAAGMTWQVGTALTVAHQPEHSIVTAADGSMHAARLVIDASGHYPALLAQPKLNALAYQAAYGVLGTFSAPPVQPRQCVLMDYRDDFLSPAERSDPPTFLYAMDLGKGRFFVEETSLAHSPGLKMAVLQDRLERRLAWMNVDMLSAEHIEHCYFPMNVAVPCRNQRVVGFGAAAGLVHPASGYSVAMSLRYAPVVASALAAVLKRPGGTPRDAAQAAWAVLWPQQRLRKRALYLFGLATLMQCSSAQLRQFFATFYAMPQSLWVGYLADSPPVRDIAATMLRLFVSAPGSLRMMLVASALRESRLLAQAVHQ